MKKIILLIMIIAIVSAAVVYSEDCVQDGNTCSSDSDCCSGNCDGGICESAGFFSKILSFFHIGTVSEETTTTSVEVITTLNKITTTTMPPVHNTKEQGSKKGKGSMSEKNNIEGAEKPETINTNSIDMKSVIDGATLTKNNIPISACCHVTICEKDNMEFICQLDDCSKYDNCREVSCLPTCNKDKHTCYDYIGTFNGAEQYIPITCEGSYEECLQNHDNCECGTRCTTKKHLCHKDGKDIACEGSLELCKQKYGECECEFRCPDDIQTCTSSIGVINGAEQYMPPVECKGPYEECMKSYDICHCGTICTTDKHTCYIHKNINGVDITSQIECDGTLEQCKQMYGDCDCEFRCPDDIQTCTSSIGVINGVEQYMPPVKCEGPYEECMKSYDVCTCGWEETTTTTMSTTTTMPIVPTTMIEPTTVTGLVTTTMPEIPTTTVDITLFTTTTETTTTVPVTTTIKIDSGFTTTLNLLTSTTTTTNYIMPIFH